MNFSLILEVTLVALLAVTLGYCVILERRLAGVKKGQAALDRTVRDLNLAVEKAGMALAALKTTTAGVSEELNDKVRRARALADELSLLTASGERIADRFDRAVSTRPQSAAPQASQSSVDEMSESLMDRLDSLRTVR